MGIVDTLFRLDGRTVVVNGGAGRIGAHICMAAADAGANVAILDMELDRANSLANELCKSGATNVIGVHADSTNRDSLEAALERVGGELGVPYGLVNAIQYRGPGFYGSDPTNVPLEAWNRVLEVNLTGVMLACQVFGGAMTKMGVGSIVNLSSTYGVVSADPRIYGQSGVNSPASYAASKAAVLNLTRYLAVHWRESNVRVNCLVPGGVFDNQAEEFVNEYTKRTPMGRMAKATDYQGAALFMLADASSYMTGATVTVDGGWTAW